MTKKDLDKLVNGCKLTRCDPLADGMTEASRREFSKLHTYNKYVKDIRCTRGILIPILSEIQEKLFSLQMELSHEILIIYLTPKNK